MLANAVCVIPRVCGATAEHSWFNCARCSTRTCIGTHGLMQCVEQVRRGLLQAPVRRSTRAAEHRRARRVGGHGRVELFDQVVELGAGRGSNLRAAALGGGVDGCQDPERGVVAIPAGGVARMSRSLLMVVWKSTVGRWVSSWMWSPARDGAAPPRCRRVRR